MSRQVTVKKIHTIQFEEFKSLGEFYDLTQNKVSGRVISDTYNAGPYIQEWSGSKSFEHAVELAFHGWDEGSIKLTNSLKKITLDERKSIRKYFIDVCGFQAMVPLYLNGVPTNMLNQRSVVLKNKVVTVNKMIGFTGNYTSEKMLKENIKTLTLINEIENAGYRVNLNVLYCSDMGSHYRIVKIRAKSANEKLNISKLAFPLCHPSMHRRMYFNYLNHRYNDGVPGRSQFGSKLFDLCKESGQFKGEYILPQTLDENVKDISDLDAHFKVK